MKRFFEFLDKFEETVLALGFIILVIIVFGQVVMRYVFSNSLAWSEEISRFLFVFITWLGSSRGVKEKKHINVNMLSDSFPSIAKYLNIISTLLSLTVTIFLSVNGVELVKTLLSRGQLTPALQIPMAIPYIAVPMGGALMSIQYIRQLLTEDIPGLRSIEEISNLIKDGE